MEEARGSSATMTAKRIHNINDVVELSCEIGSARDTVDWLFFDCPAPFLSVFSVWPLLRKFLPFSCHRRRRRRPLCTMAFWRWDKVTPQRTAVAGDTRRLQQRRRKKIVRPLKWQWCLPLETPSPTAKVICQKKKRPKSSKWIFPSRLWSSCARCVCPSSISHFQFCFFFFLS